MLTLAQEEARLLHHSFIGTEHVLLGLLREDGGLGAQALRSLGVSLEDARQRVEDVVGRSLSDSAGSPPFTPRAKKVLELSLREALQMNHSYIGTEHLVLGLVREGDGVAATVLTGMGVTLGRLRQEVLRLITEGPPSSRAAGATLTPRSPQEPHREPLCPRCGASIEVSARYRTVSVVADDDRTSLSTDVVYCAGCGTTLFMFRREEPSEG